MEKSFDQRNKQQDAKQQQNETELTNFAPTQSSFEDQNQNSSSSSQSSLSNSISLIQLDEISSFAAAKQARLPALINLVKDQTTKMEQSIDTPVAAQTGGQVRSLPAYSAEQLEQPTATTNQVQNSLPPTASKRPQDIDEQKKTTNDENQKQTNDNKAADDDDDQDLSAGFQMVDMESDELLIGPSLPAVVGGQKKLSEKNDDNLITNKSYTTPLAAQPMQNNAQLGDSLIDMVVNLRTENQNLLQALQRNNEFVRQRLDEFKLVGEQAKENEEKFAKEKADMEHDMRKLRRQNGVLSDRLKSMESKLKDMKDKVSESLEAAHSSRADSNQADFDANLYPTLDAPTLQMDISNQELLADGNLDQIDDATNKTNYMDTSDPMAGAAEQTRAVTNKLPNPLDVTNMTKDELSKYFDADKATFYAMDDRMKQCDQLEQQLNSIGNQDYEICLLQQQLNIYRQDFRLERMANLEAKIQIERLKNEIDNLCLKRIQERQQQQQQQAFRKQDDQTLPKEIVSNPTGSRYASHKLAHAERIVGRVGRKAAKSAAKAAKLAAKHAHLEEKAQALASKYSQVAATSSQAPSGGLAAATSGGSQQANGPNSGDEQQATNNNNSPPNSQHRHHHRHHHRSSGRHSSRPGIKSEVVQDLWETANKAMLTGYKMASTHVNLALDKLSEFEQSQANYLAKNKQPEAGKPSAPPMSFNQTVYNKI